MYVFEQDVPITAEIHARIMDALGDVTPDGLLAHIAIERQDGTLRYPGLWRGREDRDRFTDERPHPVVARSPRPASARPVSRRAARSPSWTGGARASRARHASE